ncbi:hypothetical protein KIN20_009591 [Parelaphostrongylus tenuis]|uniref:Uncharacterized protein n=1 Tax=Parelaphostrongylus tenuis TaxID=148309 RepID=A0AAD5MP89_PARTN|nr:hypothetical protein KIN20_009591 [Parelaphostrongylus tenuis]
MPPIINTVLARARSTSPSFESNAISVWIWAGDVKMIGILHGDNVHWIDSEKINVLVDIMNGKERETNTIN